MMLLDTDVAVDILRGYGPAVSWLQGLGDAPLSIPGLVAMELLQGCQNKSEQQRVEQTFGSYAMYWPDSEDCQAALVDFVEYRLSHNLGLLDALIAHTAIGLDEELATFNVKHYSVVRGLKTIQPY